MAVSREDFPGIYAARRTSATLASLFRLFLLEIYRRTLLSLSDLAKRNSQLRRFYRRCRDDVHRRQRVTASLSPISIWIVVWWMSDRRSIEHLTGSYAKSCRYTRVAKVDTGSTLRPSRVAVPQRIAVRCPPC